MPIATQQMKNTYLIRSFVEEAINSSQLEGASTTRSVAKELIRQGRRPIDKDEQMILNNYEAMRFIKDSTGEPLSTELILELHRILTKDTLENPDSVGRFRTDKDAVYVVDRTGGGILHTPPKAEELPERMRILCDFANETNGDVFIHPIIRAILLHFMLAYDHPFEDGNGRTARALFYWSVARQGYWIMEFLSISKIIKAAPIKYGRAFLYTETDENDTTYFVIHQLDVIRKAIQQLNSFLDRKVKEIEAAEISLRGSQKLHALLNPRQLALLRHALKHPGFVYGIKEHQRAHGVVYQTARNDLLVMSDKLKLLIKKKSGRSFIFISPDDLQKRIERVRA
jgi:Fic family protein